MLNPHLLCPGILEPPRACGLAVAVRPTKAKRFVELTGAPGLAAVLGCRESTRTRAAPASPASSASLPQHATPGGLLDLFSLP